MLQSMGSQSWTRLSNWTTNIYAVASSMNSVNPDFFAARYNLRTQLCCIFLPTVFSGGSLIKNPPASWEEAGSIPESGRSPGGRNGNPLQYSCLENAMDRGDWPATVHGLAESDTAEWLNTHTHSFQQLPLAISWKLTMSYNFPIRRHLWLQHNVWTPQSWYFISSVIWP